MNVNALVSQIASLLTALWALFQLIVSWLVIVTKVLVGLGLFYVAWSMFSLDNVNILGTNLKILPKVTPDAQKLVYLAAGVWLWFKAQAQ